MSYYICVSSMLFTNFILPPNITLSGGLIIYSLEKPKFRYNSRFLKISNYLIYISGFNFVKFTLFISKFSSSPFIRYSLGLSLGFVLIFKAN